MKIIGSMDLSGPGSTLGALWPLIAALVLGLALGAIFFGGLWWTVRRGLVSGNPAMWFGLSALGRLACVFVGFYFLARTGGLLPVAAGLLGLLIARVVVTRTVRRTA